MLVSLFMCARYKAVFACRSLLALAKTRHKARLMTAEHRVETAQRYKCAAFVAPGEQSPFNSFLYCFCLSQNNSIFLSNGDLK